MLESLAVQAIESYTPVAKTIANRCRFLEGVDCTGRSVDDYRQELLIEALKIANKYQQSYGFCSPAERRYVAKSLWNLRHTFARTHARKRTQAETALDRLTVTDVPTSTSAMEFGGWLDARESVRLLSKRLTTYETGVVLRLCDADGNVGAAWDGSVDGSRSKFYDRVAKLRAKAKRIIAGEK